MKLIKFFPPTFFLALLLTSVFSTAMAAQALRLSSEKEWYMLGGYMEVFADTSGTLTIDDIVSKEVAKKFKPVSANYLNYGYADSVFWIRLDVEMDDDAIDSVFYLDPGWYYYDKIEFFVQKNNSKTESLSCETHPYNKVENDTRLFRLDNGICNTYYLRLSSDVMTYIKPVVRNGNYVVKENSIKLASLIIPCSVIFVMIIYNLVIFFVIKHKSYLYYFLCYFFGLIFALTAHWNPITSSVIDHRFSIAAANISAMFWCFLTRSILETKENLPRFDVFLKYYPAVILAWTIFGFYAPIRFFSVASLFVNGVSFNTSFIVSMILSIRGHAIARMIFWAWLVGIGLFGAYALSILGLVGFDSVLIPSLCFAFESLLVSAVLAYRFKLINQKYLVAEAVAEAKSSFLASMSHEIRTPLTAVLGYADILRNQNLSAEARRYLGNIRIAGNHLLSIINDILDMAKIEAGKIELERIEFNLGGMLNKTLKICAPQACVNGNELAVRVEPGLPETLVGDPVRLEQILINMVSNASKFTTNGDILVRVHDAGHGAEQPAGAFVLGIDVRDTGIGIPADKQDALFQTFNQAGSATTRKFGGTGLGLAISRKLANLMGGDLTFASQEGKGSTFTATAVLERGVSEPVERILPLPASGKVLVIDDNAMARDALADVLTGLGLVPLVVGSCASALEKARSTQGICLVMVDGEMLDGDFALVEELFAAGLDAETPLIMMEHALDSKAAGIASERIRRRITKPVTTTRLAGALLEVFAPQEKEREGVPAEARYDMLQGKHALVVDDNEFNVEVISELLFHVGIEVFACSSGLAALEKLGAGLKVDVVLMDVEMPEMNGYETTRRIRAELGLTGVPVIALTANVFREIQDKCLASGMNDCLTKPVDTKMLYKKLVEWTVK